jgi:NIPSNAP protein
MERRKFLGSSLAASAALAVTASEVLAGGRQDAGGSAGRREFYQLRRYQLSNGPQRKLADDYFRDALVPALNRMEFNPIGVFNVTIGPETPVMYVLIPSMSVERLVMVDDRLLKDDEYSKAAAPFLNAPAKEPAYARMESSLMQAYEKMPKITLPPVSTSKSPRVFELRTYESPSNQDHWRKIEQMSSGEGDIFTKAGIPQVFYGDTLIGPRLPNLTYMLCFNSLSERDAKWDAFRNSPEWKTLSTNPRYAFEDIVSNITNIMLAPTAYSQI